MSFGRSFFLTMAMAVAVAVVSHHASAGAGTFTLGRTTIQETNGIWRVNFTMTLPKPPPTARPTIKFSFTRQTVLDESGAATPVKRPVIVVHEDQIAFGDGSGTIWKQARADISIVRDEGFVPGEYKLVVKGPYGEIGQPVMVTLMNPSK